MKKQIKRKFEPVSTTLIKVIGSRLIKVMQEEMEKIDKEISNIKVK